MTDPNVSDNWQMPTGGSGAAMVKVHSRAETKFHKWCNRQLAFLQRQGSNKDKDIDKDKDKEEFHSLCNRQLGFIQRQKNTTDQNLHVRNHMKSMSERNFEISRKGGKKVVKDGEYSR